MLTIADEGGRGGQPNADHCWRGGEGGSPKSWRLLTRGGWGYNFVSQMGFRQPKICEKETIYVNLVLLCKAKTKHRSKTHLSPLKCHVKKCFCLNLKVRSGKGGSGKCWRLMTRGEGGVWKPQNLTDVICEQPLTVYQGPKTLVAMQILHFWSYLTPPFFAKGQTFPTFQLQLWLWD